MARTTAPVTSPHVHNGLGAPSLSPAPEITAQVMTILPEQALDLFRQRHSNRPISKARVRQMIDDLRQGRWHTTGEPIILDNDGRVLDGQHRLLACQESGVALVTMVVLGVPLEAMPAIDSGRSKGAADILHMAQVPQARFQAAAAKWLWRYEQGRMRLAALALRNQDLPAYLAARPTLRSSLDWGVSVRALLPPSCASALHAVMASKDAALAKHYYHALATGAELKAADVAHVVREKLLKDKSRPAHFVTVCKAAQVVLGWQALRAGRTVSASLTWKGKSDAAVPFPVIT